MYLLSFLIFLYSWWAPDRPAIDYTYFIVGHPPDFASVVKDDPMVNIMFRGTNPQCKDFTLPIILGSNYNRDGGVELRQSLARK